MKKKIKKILLLLIDAIRAYLTKGETTVFLIKVTESMVFIDVANSDKTIDRVVVQIRHERPIDKYGEKVYFTKPVFTLHDYNRELIVKVKEYSMYNKYFAGKHSELHKAQQKFDQHFKEILSRTNKEAHDAFLKRLDIDNFESEEQFNERKEYHAKNPIK